MNNITVLYVGEDILVKEYLDRFALALGWEVTMISEIESTKSLIVRKPDIWLLDLDDGGKNEKHIEKVLDQRKGKKILLATDEDEKQYF